MERRVPAAAQALEVLAVIAERAEPVSAADLACKVGLARSTTYYLLNVLVEYGYVILSVSRCGDATGPPSKWSRPATIGADTSAVDQVVEREGGQVALAVTESADARRQTLLR